MNHKVETVFMEKMKAQNQITLNAMKDYYTGNISNEFKKARYVMKIRNNVFDAIDAVNRFIVIDILAIIMTESMFRPDAVSPKKAMGLMQIMHHKKYITPVDGVESPFDINCSVKAGLECLKRKYDMFGDERKAIIAYWGIVKRKDGTWVDKYYNKVMANKEIIQETLNAKD
jgi:soluble lytic murein transglycosylase-like protein